MNRTVGTQTPPPTAIPTPPSPRPLESSLEMIGVHLRLRSLAPEDHRSLYELALSDDAVFRWRHGGAPPSFDAFVQGLYGGVLGQFVVSPLESPALLGLVVCYRADLGNGTAYLA